MDNPDGRTFYYSQASLQDYLDCAYRFYLRYRMHLVYPAQQTQPVLEFERRQRLGEDFHTLLQRLFSGIPATVLEESIREEPMLGWWRNFKSAWDTLEGLAPDDTDWTRQAESSLRSTRDGFGLSAKYDLLAVHAGKKALIYDWKTTPIPPNRASLAKRVQTKVYPYLLVTAGKSLNSGAEIQPEQVEMVYWSPEHPDNSVRFPYSLTQYEDDRQYLTKLVAEIESLDAEEFTRTEDLRRCRYCEFRSYCERGNQPGSLDEMEEDPQLRELLELDLRVEPAEGSGNKGWE